MKDVNSSNFGLLIAYLVPGAITLWGLSYVSPTVNSWFSVSAESTPTIGGFLFGTVAAIATGLLVNAIRWHTVDPLHFATGVPRKCWDYPRAPDHVPALQFLVANQFRYYECYANSAVAIALAATIWLRAGDRPSPWLLLGIATLELLLWSASRRTLCNYHRRINAFLANTLEPREPDSKKSVDPRFVIRYTDQSTVTERTVWQSILRSMHRLRAFNRTINRRVCVK